jgi:ankyrin repeat protein
MVALDNHKRTPFEIAVRFNHIHVVRELADRGADVNTKNVHKVSLYSTILMEPLRTF